MVMVPRVSKRTKYQIETDSIHFLTRHFPERLSEPGRLDVMEMWEILADEYGLLPGVSELSDGVEGMAWPDGRVEVSEATYRGAQDGRGRPRFTMCHEVYHAIAHRRQIQKVLVDSGEPVLYYRSNLHPYVDPEWQANQFAAFLLMPTLPMQKVLLEAGSNKVSDVMYFFGVTQTAARIRIAGIPRPFERVHVLGSLLGQRELPF